MIGGEPPDVTEVEADCDRVLVARRLAWIKIEERKQDVVPLGDSQRIDAHSHQCIPRVRIDHDPSLLIPFAVMLHALGVARSWEDVAPGQSNDDQYTLKYRSSSHSLTFPMYSCHSSRFASTNRS